MSNHTKTGGILTIISGLWALFYVMIGAFWTLLPLFIGTMAADQGQELSSELLPLTIFGVIISLFFLLLGALAVTGGIFALKKKYWGLCLAGAIAGTILLFPVGIAGIILISLGRSEFSTDATASTLEESHLPSNEGETIENKATIAGILSIISGAFGVLRLGNAFYTNSLFSSMSSFMGEIDPAISMNQFLQSMQNMFIYYGAAQAIIGVLIIVAGVMTLKKMNWGLALAGAIASTVIFFPCGIPAILLIANAQNEFPAN